MWLQIPAEYKTSVVSSIILWHQWCDHIFVLLFIRRPRDALSNFQFWEVWLGMICSLSPQVDNSIPCINALLRRGRSPHSFSIEFSPKCSPILAKILVIWIFYWIFAKFFTNFGENFGELKNLVSFWVTKMSPILVTIIPPNFVLFLSPILAKISVIW